MKFKHLAHNIYVFCSLHAPARKRQLNRIPSLQKF